MSEQQQSQTDSNQNHSNLQTSLAWVESMAALVAAVLRLGLAEMSLARADLGRLMVVAVLLVPLAVLTWLALGVLAAWLVFEMAGSALAGIAAFAAIQVITLLLLLNKVKTYRHSLSLPATRAQIQTIINEVRYEAGRTDSTDRET